jgi:hypothetical protein
MISTTILEVIIFGSIRFFRTKTSSNRLGSVFPVWLGFLGFVSVFFGLGSVRFDVLLIKLKPDRTGRFFQNFNRFNRFFFSIRFLLFFLLFSRFNYFFDFFAHP